VVLAPVADPLAASAEGRLDVDRLELFPWPPDLPPAALHLVRGSDPAATAGIYYDAVERTLALRQRVEALRAILRREIRRLLGAEGRAERDGASFADPDRYRRFGEAILAGMAVARRVGEHVFVPDPYDPEGAELAVPAPRGLRLSAVADDQFRRHRRARRGIEAARARAETVRARRTRLEELAAGDRGGSGADDLDRLEEGMRAEGIPVGLEPRSGATAARGRANPPRVEGVRLFTSADGITILAGRTGKDNDRLTFRLASPEDFWLHAAGRPGAHVVIRNDRAEPRPPESTLLEAAAVAAWFSDSRGEVHVDVHWTRRKYVRRARGGAPGAVLLKRFETVRVRPVLPERFDDQP
jgi:predicted ribosome quality control (RQC) complex YloA/Tae2 family protein